MIYERRYSDQVMQYAYKNACRCLYYGCGMDEWNDCGLHEDLRDIVWKQAFTDMAEDDV